MLHRKVQTARSRILAYIESHPGSCGVEVASALGIAKSTTYGALTSLANLGQLTRTGYPGNMLYYPKAGVIKPQPQGIDNFGISTGMKLLNDCLATVRS